MKAGDNIRSWASATNHERIGRSIEKMFLDRNRKIKKAVTGDRNKIGEVRKGIKFF